MNGQTENVAQVLLRAIESAPHKGRSWDIEQAGLRLIQAFAALEAERDAARQWAVLWKRMARRIDNRLHESAHLASTLVLRQVNPDYLPPMERQLVAERDALRAENARLRRAAERVGDILEAYLKKHPEERLGWEMGFSSLFTHDPSAPADTRLPAMPLDTRVVTMRYRVVGDGTPTRDSSDTPADLPPANRDAAITAILRRDALEPPFAGTA